MGKPTTADVLLGYYHDALPVHRFLYGQRLANLPALTGKGKKNRIRNRVGLDYPLVYFVEEHHPPNKAKWNTTDTRPHGHRGMGGGNYLNENQKPITPFF